MAWLTRKYAIGHNHAMARQKQTRYPNRSFPFPASEWAGVAHIHFTFEPVQVCTEAATIARLIGLLTTGCCSQMMMVCYDRWSVCYWSGGMLLWCTLWEVVEKKLIPETDFFEQKRLKHRILLGKRGRWGGPSAPQCYCSYTGGSVAL